MWNLILEMFLRNVNIIIKQRFKYFFFFEFLTKKIGGLNFYNS